MCGMETPWYGRGIAEDVQNKRAVVTGMSLFSSA